MLEGAFVDKLKNVSSCLPSNILWHVSTLCCTSFEFWKQCSLLTILMFMTVSMQNLLDHSIKFIFDLTHFRLHLPLYGLNLFFNTCALLLPFLRLIKLMQSGQLFQFIFKLLSCLLLIFLGFLYCHFNSPRTLFGKLNIIQILWATALFAISLRI